MKFKTILVLLLLTIFSVFAQEINAVPDSSYNVNTSNNCYYKDISIGSISTLPDKPNADYPENLRILRYHPNNMLDNNPLTVWSEGEDGPGIGLELSFSGSYVMIDEIVIMPGYFDGRYYSLNNRVKQITLSDYSGTSITVNLKDEMTPQRITLEEELNLSSLKIRINAVYPGEKWDDTCISEIVFFSSGTRLQQIIDNRIIYEKGEYRIISAGNSNSIEIVNYENGEDFYHLEDGYAVFDSLFQDAVDINYITEEGSSYSFDPETCSFDINCTYYTETYYPCVMDSPPPDIGPSVNISGRFFLIDYSETGGFKYIAGY